MSSAGSSTGSTATSGGGIEWTALAEALLEDAFKLSLERSHGTVSSLHVAAALFADPRGMASRLAAKGGADPLSLHREFVSLVVQLPTDPSAPQKPIPAPDLRVILDAVERRREALGDSLVALDHFMLALHEVDVIAQVLDAAGLTHKAIKRIVMEMRAGKKITNKFQENTYDALEKYATDLNKMAEEGKLDPIIGRDEEIRRAIRVLSRRTKNNPIFIGEPGVGKTAVVEGIAQRIVAGDVPESLNARIYSLDMQLEGLKRGSFQIDLFWGDI